MSDFLDRLKAEHLELSEKAFALNIFIEESNAFKHISKYHQVLLVDQLNAMNNYQHCLALRLADLMGD